MQAAQGRSEQMKRSPVAGTRAANIRQLPKPGWPARLIRRMRLQRHSRREIHFSISGSISHPCPVSAQWRASHTHGHCSARTSEQGTCQPAWLLRLPPPSRFVICGQQTTGMEKLGSIKVRTKKKAKTNPHPITRIITTVLFPYKGSNTCVHRILLVFS